MADGSEQPPFFHATAVFTWRPNRRYRVYVLPGELVFVYAGAEGAVPAALGAQFGLIGALLVVATNPEKKNRERQEALDGARLDELLADHKHNFRASAADLSDVSLAPTTFWFRANYSQPHAGLLRFTHPKQGKVCLAVTTADDLHTAIEQLPRALGDKVTVSVEWDADKGHFVRRL